MPTQPTARPFTLKQKKTMTTKQILISIAVALGLGLTGMTFATPTPCPSIAEMNKVLTALITKPGEYYDSHKNWYYATFTLLKNNGDYTPALDHWQKTNKICDKTGFVGFKSANKLAKGSLSLSGGPKFYYQKGPKGKAICYCDYKVENSHNFIVKGNKANSICSSINNPNR